MLLGVLLLLVVAPVVMVGLYCAIPADIATLVCMHRRNGDECITTLCFLRFLFLLLSPFWSESVAFGASLRDCSRALSKLAMRTPSARHCVQPL